MVGYTPEGYFFRIGKDAIIVIRGGLLMFKK